MSMRTERFECPFCNRKYVLDVDGALPAHNVKGKENTLENLCKGSHKLAYLLKIVGTRE